MDALKYYDKIEKNEEIKKYIKTFSKSIWKELEIAEKLEVITSLVDELNTIYPELGEVTFAPEFLYEVNGVSIDNTILININNINDVNNRFVVLQTIFHELGHFYQNEAMKMYDNEKKILELFSEDELKNVKKNNDISKLNSVENYIQCDDNNFLEYFVQPVEYDTEKFSYELMVKFREKLFREDTDLLAIDDSINDFRFIDNLINLNKKNFIQFNKIYHLNYEDYLKDTREFFIKDEIKSEIYYKNMENLGELDIYDTMCLFDYCFWKTYTSFSKVVLINRYLELMGFSFDVASNGNTIEINNKKVDSNYPIDVLEVIFNEMADEEIKRILVKKGKLAKYEEEIVLNFNGNLIEEKDNPLFYNVQPYMLYKRNYVLRNFYTFFKVFDKVHDHSSYYFEDYEKYISKYDIVTLMKKVEYLTDMKFDDFYDKMIEKMKTKKKTLQ